MALREVIDRRDEISSQLVALRVEKEILEAAVAQHFGTAYEAEALAAVDRVASRIRGAEQALKRAEADVQDATRLDLREHIQELLSERDKAQAESDALETLIPPFEQAIRDCRALQRQYIDFAADLDFQAKQLEKQLKAMPA